MAGDRLSGVASLRADRVRISPRRGRSLNLRAPSDRMVHTAGPAGEDRSPRTIAVSLHIGETPMGGKTGRVARLVCS